SCTADERKKLPQDVLFLLNIKESDNPENSAISTMVCANKDVQDKAVEDDDDDTEASEDGSIFF
ncbi:hypothetical protein ILUMI_14228, partial [Ignelater luminosus]